MREKDREKETKKWMEEEVQRNKDEDIKTKRQRNQGSRNSQKNEKEEIAGRGGEEEVKKEEVKKWKGLR